MIIGLTGSFGTGKTTVAKCFKKLGAEIIDADKIVHSFIDQKARKNLGEVVFKRKSYYDLVCRIIHPIVIKKIKQEIKQLKNKKRVIVIDAPLLIEVGLEKIVDKIVVVKASRANQLKRLTRRTGLKKEDILKRIKFQMPLREKVKRADFVIDNDCTLNQTRKQITNFWRKL